MGAVTHEVGDWLDALGLGQYAQVFAENGIDFDVLPDLTDRDLEKLARISHADRCIGVLVLRKSFCDNGLSQDQGIPDADRV